MTEQQLPWYKQFWPWFLISIPLASVIAGIFMIVISIDGADTLVNEDYYKQGLAINKQFDKSKKAQQLGLKATLAFEQDKLQINLSSDKPVVESLVLEFSHATVKAKDFQLRLQQASEGQYFSVLKPEQLATIKGKWYLTLTPHSEQWHLKGRWFLPSEQPLTLGD
ncbi:FixH family protein [Kangiella sp. TOML190]|uniref:FixH family protein n=1 Tax=Kangiella sp. TOML190 TaxID=2931351 RepID=UPI00203F53E1|nr:FixH family protein [Kangiella sp. TOML190]